MDNLYYGWHFTVNKKLSLDLKEEDLVKGKTYTTPKFWKPVKLLSYGLHMSATPTNAVISAIHLWKDEEITSAELSYVKGRARDQYERIAVCRRRTVIKVFDVTGLIKKLSDIRRAKKEEDAFPSFSMDYHYGFIDALLNPVIVKHYLKKDNWWKELPNIERFENKLTVKI